MKRVLPYLAGMLLVFLCSDIKAQSALESYVWHQQFVDGNYVGKDQIGTLELQNRFVSKHNEVEHFYFAQYFKGLKVFNGQLQVHVQNGRIVSVNNQLVDISSDLVLEFTVNPEDAIKSALRSIDINEVEVFQVLGSINEGDNTYNISDPSNTLRSEVKVEKMLQMKDRKLYLVYNVETEFKDHSHHYHIRVDASNGDFVDKSDYVNSCSLEHSVEEEQSAEIISSPVILEQARLTKKQAVNSYNVFPFPIESPNHGSRRVVFDPADSLSSPFGWHDVNGSVGHEFTYTRGNNVWAREDQDGDNQNGQSVDGGSDLEFDAFYSDTVSAEKLTDAAIINLFYWNNIMHDVWYHYGFDEVAGNFQFNNYNRGGIEGDYVIADAQDNISQSLNNANFATPPEGSGNPRMQMFLWGNRVSSDILVVNAPSSIEGPISAAPAQFGPRLTSTPIVGDIVRVDDNSANPTEGCNTIVNTTEVSGKVALIDRGNCTFVQKVKNAQNAGAIAVIIVNNINGNPFNMSGSDNSITIPSLMISRAAGDILKNQLNKKETITVTLSDSSLESSFFRDSDFDNGVIAHEYGHGISNRLTGGASNTLCLSNQEQMGEGWSDFFSLVMTHQPGDSGGMRRGIGTYVRGQNTNGRGIRPFPYSTNMAINPVTYGDMPNNTFTVPHGVGSIWCSMLWDLYWAFIDEYGYDPDIYEGTGGNNIAMQLVIDGLKLQKCSPGFEDGRDAILLADELNNDGANQRLIWEVFARRGLGYSADQGVSTSKLDGIEAFDVPDFLDEVTIVKSTEAEVKGGDDLTYSFTVTNNSSQTKYNVTVIDTLDDRLTFIERKSDCGFDIDGNILTWVIDSIQGKAEIACSITTQVANERFSTPVFIDNVEENEGIWTTELADGTGQFERTSIIANSGDFCWFIDNPNSKSDRSLKGSLEIADSNMIFVFYHFYNTESGWDGSVIEIDSGNGWIDAEPFFVENGYNSIIADNPASAISLRPAFTGNSQGFIRSSISLAEFEGKEVTIRFRFVSDAAQGGSGWFIDDISLYSRFERILNTVHVDQASGYKANSSVSTLLFEGKDAVGIEDLVSSNNWGFIVYPNPSTDDLNIRNISRSDAIVQLRDANGRLIWNGEVERNAETTLNASQYARGVYTITAKSSEGVKTFKVILQ